MLAKTTLAVPPPIYTESKAQHRKKKDSESWDRFASAMITGLVSRMPVDLQINEEVSDKVAIFVGRFADSMLKEKRKRDLC